MNSVTALGGMPARWRWSSRGGSVMELGQGRVMSQTEMAALLFPAASSISGRHPIGESRAATRLLFTSATAGAERVFKISYFGPSGRLRIRPRLPKATAMFIGSSSSSLTPLCASLAASHQTLLWELRRVSIVSSGRQSKRNGTPTAPIPRFTYSCKPFLR